MSSIPWGKIRAEWLKGGTSYKKLGEKYGVSPKTIGNRASKEGWGKEKGKISEKVMEETRGRIVRARVNHLEKLIAANEALLDGLMQMAEIIQKKPMTTLTDAQGTLRNAESFAKALKTAMETQRDLHNLKTLDQKFAEKKWREQKKIEKEKLAGPIDDQEVWEIQAPEGEELDG